MNTFLLRSILSVMSHYYHNMEVFQVNHHRIKHLSVGRYEAFLKRKRTPLHSQYEKTALRLFTTNKFLPSENEMLSLIRNALLKICLIRNINPNKVMQSWQINGKKDYSHNIASCCLHNTSIFNHMNSLSQSNLKKNYLS